jgi:ribonuclease G
MANELIINATLPESRVAYLENGEIQELVIERDNEKGIVGNIYKGKVLRVLPGMQAAFVDIGHEKAAFLYVDDVYFPDMDHPLETRPIPENINELLSSEKQIGIKPQENMNVQDEEKVYKSRASFSSGSVRKKFKPKQNKQKKSYVAQSTPKIGVHVGGVDPTSPEMIAEMQKQYGSQMLDISEEEYYAELEAKRKQQEQQGNQGELNEIESEHSEAKIQDINTEEEQVLDDDESNLYAEEWVEEVASVQAHHSPDTEEPISDGSIISERLNEVDLEQKEDEDIENDEFIEENDDDDIIEQEGDEEHDEEVIQFKTIRKYRRGRVNIADLLKEGQEILVQVAKDPIATKGARLTCHISLPGRYLVFMPTVDHIGVSRRIESEEERRRLKKLISAIRPEGTGVIVRTASGNQTNERLKQDLDYLVQTWNDIQEKFKKHEAPYAVYTDLSVSLRAIRDVISDNIDKIIVDSKREYKNINRFINKFMPHLKDKLELYKGEMPIFDYYGIDMEIEKAMSRQVWLKSGGYIVIDQAEALVAIDVNTGRFVGKQNLEETIVKTNLEAVKEIAYQIRLRNLGGIIIIDLIDMEKEYNKERVYKALEAELAKDRARPTIMRISQLGLIEMTRKRTRDSLVRLLGQTCSHCRGRAYTKNAITVSYDILRDIERESFNKNVAHITIQCNPEVADYLLGEKSDVILALEQEYKIKISVRSNGAYPLENYEFVVETQDGKTTTQTSDERRTQLKQVISAHLQKLYAVEKQKEEEAKKELEKQKQEEELRARQKAYEQELANLSPQEKLYDDSDTSSEAQRWRFFKTNRLKKQKIILNNEIKNQDTVEDQIVSSDASGVAQAELSMRERFFATNPFKKHHVKPYASRENLLNKKNDEIKVESNSEDSLTSSRWEKIKQKYLEELTHSENENASSNQMQTEEAMEQQNESNDSQQTVNQNDDEKHTNQS